MKNLILVLFAVIALISCNKKVETSETQFWVRGNCDMCKERIEASLTKVDGVSKAIWDIDSKQCAVSFDAAKTSDAELQKAVANVGHATKNVPMDEKAHSELPDCCKVESENIDTTTATSVNLEEKSNCCDKLSSEECKKSKNSCCKKG